MEKELWSDRKRVLFLGLPLSFTTYRLTSNRLFINSGFLTQKQDEVRLYRITDVSLSRTLMQRIFGLSTIHCNSSDKTLGNFDIINVKDGENVKELLSQSVEEERMARRVYTRENMVDTVDDGDQDQDQD
ncbi:MAG: PH domain-containing protein [Intestinibacter sp.]|uniref:PH domain-containing protein n=1 Tax=Intestinibacter sp. TaxID=1965304 RepID=UPI002A83EADC|nr:PH domain-containing protein [Intestinibacter sp.]MDY4575335.1 PH domain-containing protein [Intestinibacter sp.]